jgi:hypothetical protein
LPIWLSCFPWHHSEVWPVGSVISTAEIGKVANGQITVTESIKATTQKIQKFPATSSDDA